MIIKNIKSIQISFIAWKIRKMREASSDTVATETYYMKGCYNLGYDRIPVGMRRDKQ